MSDSLDAQPGGRLLKLPAEVRLLIYEHLFPPCKIDIHAPRRNEWVDSNDLHIEWIDIAILSTCRTIYAEATPMPYENAEFCVRFACSGPNLQSKKASKHNIYARLLHDLQGRVRPLFSLARRISLSISFTDSRRWNGAEKSWFRRVTSELARLGEAEKLEHLHITFEADTYPDYTGHEYAKVGKEFAQVLDVLSGVESRATLTIAVHPSLRKTDVELSTYLDTLDKLPWTDTTNEVYAKRLVRMFDRRSHIEQEIRNKRQWLASQDPEYLEEFDNHRRSLSCLGRDDLLHLAQSIDWPPLDVAFAVIHGLEPELEGLHVEITSIEEHLKWFAIACSAHAKTK